MRRTQLIGSVFLTLSLLLLAGCVSFLGMRGRPEIGDPAAWRAALPSLEQRARETPEDANLLAQLATAHFFAGHPAAAESLAASVLAQEPRHGMAAYVRALLFEQQERWIPADSIYRRRSELVSMDRGLQELMSSRHEIVSRQITREQMLSDLVLVTRSEEIVLDAYALVVRRIIPVGASRRDSVLAVGLTHFVTNAFAQIETLSVIDNTRRDVLEEEISRSQDVSFTESSRLVARTVNAGLVFAGRTGLREESDEVVVQYGIDDLLADRESPSYRGTAELVEFSSPVRYILLDVGREVVRAAEELLRIPLSAEMRERLALPPTEQFDAFLAYAEGLLWEERGLFERARTRYEDALRLDSGFEWAAEGAERVSGAGEHGEPLPPVVGPGGGPDADYERRAAEIADAAVDEMPGERSEEPSPTPVTARQVRIIVRPR